MYTGYRSWYFRITNRLKDYKTVSAEWRLIKFASQMSPDKFCCGIKQILENLASATICLQILQKIVCDCIPEYNPSRFSLFGFMYKHNCQTPFRWWNYILVWISDTIASTQEKFKRDSEVRNFPCLKNYVNWNFLVLVLIFNI